MTIINPTSSKQATLPSSNPTPSIWLSSPSRILHNHRTTETLPTAADTVIIGSGITGAFAAHFLLKDPKHSKKASNGETADDHGAPAVEVLMLEARDAVSGATGRNGGHCAPQLYGLPEETMRFQLENLRFLKGFVEWRGLEGECEWRDVRGVHAYYDEELFRAAVEVVGSGGENWKIGGGETGVEEALVRVVEDREELRQYRLGEDVVGAIINAEAATLWPYKLVAAVLEELLQDNLDEKEGGRSRGGHQRFNLQTNTAVTNLQILGNGSWCVHAARGMVVAKNVLLATNGYVSHLLPAFTDLIVPTRGQMAALHPPIGLSGESALAGKHSYLFLDGGKTGTIKDEYLIQRPSSADDHGIPTSSHLMLGGGRRLGLCAGIGSSCDSRIDEAVAEYLREALYGVLDIEKSSSHLRRTLEPEFEWTGIMGFSADELPWVGAVPDTLGGGSGLYVCAGFTGHGMPNAALCARAVVALMDNDGVIAEHLPAEYRITMKRIQRVRTATCV